MQSEELWPTQNPQLPALLILLFSSPPLSLFLSPPFRLPSPPSLFLVPSPFPSLFLSRFLSIFLSFFFFLSLSFPFSLFFFTRSSKVESDLAAAREVSLPAAAFESCYTSSYIPRPPPFPLRKPFKIETRCSARSRPSTRAGGAALPCL